MVEDEEGDEVADDGVGGGCVGVSVAVEVGMARAAIWRRH